MNCATVPASQITRLGRWDTKFHIARVEHDPAVRRLLALPEADFARLWELVPMQKEALQIVIRRRLPTGTEGKPSLNYLSREERAVYLALVLKELAVLDRDARALEDQAADIRQRRQEISNLVAPSGDDYSI